MKGIRIIALLALLNAGLLKAADFTETNRMPEPVHALMEKAGYAIVQTNLVSPAQDTNSLRYLPLIERNQFTPFETPATKAGWSFWNNTSIKHISRNTDPVNIFAPATLSPYTALSQFEYDITYSFNF
jgi:hypothetical protein